MKEDSDYASDDSGDSYSDYSDDNDDDYIVYLNGTIDDAYKYYNINGYCDENIKEFYKKYKISDNDKCILCKQKHKEIYSFCDNHHDKGICLSCFATLKVCKCPLCNENIIKFNRKCMLCKFI